MASFHRSGNWPVDNDVLFMYMHIVIYTQPGKLIKSVFKTMLKPMYEIILLVDWTGLELI